MDGKKFKSCWFFNIKCCKNKISQYQTNSIWTSMQKERVLCKCRKTKFSNDSKFQWIWNKQGNDDLNSNISIEYFQRFLIQFCSRFVVQKKKCSMPNKCIFKNVWMKKLIRISIDSIGFCQLIVCILKM